MDRFEARKQIVADLEAGGYLVLVRKHQHVVGHCYRCDTIVEPRVSKQWFVKMKPLAEPALEAVKSGKIKIGWKISEIGVFLGRFGEDIESLLGMDLMERFSWQKANLKRKIRL